HRSLVNFTEIARLKYKLTPHDRILQFASISFDTAAEEIYPSLISGGQIVLRVDEMLNSVAIFLQQCQKFQLTVLDLPTAYWHQLTLELANKQLKLPKSLRLVIIGGEYARSEIVDLWRQNVGTEPQLVNTYGPTEATVVATMFHLSTETDELPIGRAIHNIQTYVLDNHLQPLPIGVPGELHLGKKDAIKVANTIPSKPQTC
ncbi:nonribosomal peptide synthetase adenylation domain protein, partial [Candidatus Thiomargarita nelsonii]